MDRRSLVLPFMTLVVLTVGCASTLPPNGGATEAATNPGFTNSNLRSAIYQWPAEDAEIRNLCLQNSLVIFTTLQECAGAGEGRDKIGDGLEYLGCGMDGGGRTARFLAHPGGSSPWDVTVEFDRAGQRFTLAATAADVRGKGAD